MKGEIQFLFECDAFPCMLEFIFIDAIGLYPHFLHIVVGDKTTFLMSTERRRVRNCFGDESLTYRFSVNTLSR